MEQCIINQNQLKKNKNLKTAQKASKKYYHEKLFAKKQYEPKAKIRKFTDMHEIPFYSFCSEEQELALNHENTVREFTKEGLIALCEENHLTGRSGNGFPVADKLRSYQKEQGILLINGVECDPGLVHDAWIYRNKRKEIACGIKLLNAVFQFKRVLLATKEPLLAEIPCCEEIKVKDRFPMGYENALIKTALNVTVPQGTYPAEYGILVMNLQTVLAIVQCAIAKERGVLAGDFKYITVADLQNAKAVCVKVPIGINAREVAAKIFKRKDGKSLYVGGGALQCHPAKTGELITDQTGYIAYGKMPEYENVRKCVGCGACTSHCPVGVNVRRMIQHVEKNGKTAPEKCSIYHPEYCIGCGACTYFCRAGKDTREVVAWAKNR